MYPGRAGGDGDDDIVCTEYGVVVMVAVVVVVVVLVVISFRPPPPACGRSVQMCGWLHDCSAGPLSVVWAGMWAEESSQVGALSVHTSTHVHKELMKLYRKGTRRTKEQKTQTNTDKYYNNFNEEQARERSGSAATKFIRILRSAGSRLFTGTKSETKYPNRVALFYRGDFFSRLSVYLCIDAGPSTTTNPTNLAPISTNTAAIDVPIYVVRPPLSAFKTVFNS